MKAIELIGKLAVRTAPAQYGNGNSDNSYSTDPILIVNATDTHIVYKHPKGSLFYHEDRVSLLNWCWNDNNWTDYNKLMVIDRHPSMSDCFELLGKRIDEMFLQVQRELSKLNRSWK